MTSDDDSLADLADGWIALQTVKKQAHDELFWSFEKMDELLDRCPEAAWRVIDLIWRRDPSDFMLARLAAGSVEDLLMRHGPAFIDRVWTLARQEPVFRWMLGAVWPNAIAEPVWQRLKQIAGPSF